MNTLKKLFSLCLALMLLMSLVVPMSVAAEDETTKYKISINGTSANHDYVAYQIFTGNMKEVPAVDKDKNPIVGEDGNQLQVATLGITGWGTHLDETTFLDALKKDATFVDATSNTNVFAGASSALDVASIITNWTKGSNNLRRFAEIAAECCTKGDAIEPAQDGNVYTFTLDSGYYLFMDRDNDENIDYYTELMLEVVQNETVTPKGDVPEVNKLVTTDTKIPYKKMCSVTGIQEFIFRLEGDLPTNYDDYSTYYYEFQDYVGNGMVYQEGTLSILIDHKSADAQDTTLASDAYNVKYTGNELTITFENLKPYATLQSDKIVVTYKAKLVANKADDEKSSGYQVGNPGNINSVKLKYSNDPNFEDKNRTGISTEDTASVFTYGLTIEKVDGATKTPLPGAQFILYRYTVENGTSSANMGLQTQAGEIPEYAIFSEAGELKDWTQELQDDSGDYKATVLTSGPNGQVTVTGLSNATYHLREIAPPAGYNNLDYDPSITISPTFTEATATDPVTLSALKYTLNLTTDGTGNVDTGIVTIQIENSAGQTLPSTGGMGTTVFYVVGGILVMLAVVLLITKKRMHNN